MLFALVWGVDVELNLEFYWWELIGYCYCMFGVGYEVEDVVQEMFVWVWRAVVDFEVEQFRVFVVNECYVGKNFLRNTICLFLGWK